MAPALVATIAAVAFVCCARAGENADGPAFSLHDPGTEDVVDYEEYGVFSGVGTYEYKYTITDPAGLAIASGEGIDPNTDVEKDPAWLALPSRYRMPGNHWEHMGTSDPQSDFFAWATAYKESPGVRLFFTAKALERGRHYIHALKAYRAAMILYPDAFCWNRELTWTWLIAPAAWSEIINLTRMHPELGLKLTGAFITAETALDGNPAKNAVAVTPGRFTRTAAGRQAKGPDRPDASDIVERRGGKRSACVKYRDGRWALEVDGKPFIVKGVTYGPVKVGRQYDWDWMNADQDKDGRNDVAYQSWVDKNRNNRRDDDEPETGDFALLRDMGCNTIRLFNTIPFNKKLLRDLYKTYGIKVLICDPLGAYTVHSGADWGDGTDYTDRDQLSSMKKSVEDTVKRYRDEEWLLGYILGNENNMPADYMGVNASRTQAASQPRAYAEFLNEVAAMVHALDPDRIVGVGNLELDISDSYAMYAPELDFIGVNSYPGQSGFGSLWIRAKRIIDRPILITEFGCDAYSTGKGPDEGSQSAYLKNAWDDIEYNSAYGDGEGNSIGGIIFEWLDEWWKDTRGHPADEQNSDPTFEFSFPDGFSQEEWLGIVGQGDGSRSPFLRSPRKAYYTMKDLWNRPR